MTAHIRTALEQPPETPEAAALIAERKGISFGYNEVDRLVQILAKEGVSPCVFLVSHICCHTDMVYIHLTIGFAPPCLHFSLSLLHCYLPLKHSATSYPMQIGFYKSFCLPSLFICCFSLFPGDRRPLLQGVWFRRLPAVAQVAANIPAAESACCRRLSVCFLPFFSLHKYK